MINMNLPAIDNKMKNHQGNQFRPQPSSSLQGFGLGIQVFKIESAKNVEGGLRAKNRTAIRNIENPAQTQGFKPPLVPKPKRLPSLEKSNSQIGQRERVGAMVSAKMEAMTQNGMTDKIYERKQPNVEVNSIVTPVSYSMRKKANMSTEKNIVSGQATKPANQKNFIIEKEKPGRALGNKMSQTAPPQTMYKPQQLYYEDYHAQHEMLLKFYQEFEGCQRQHVKEVKQLKKLKENELDEETCERIEYLQSLEGKVATVIEAMEKREFEERSKVVAKPDEKKPKKAANTIVPVTGFQVSEMDLYEFDGIESYENRDYAGGFKLGSYQMVDLAPVIYQSKQESDDQQ